MDYATPRPGGSGGLGAPPGGGGGGGLGSGSTPKLSTKKFGRKSTASTGRDGGWAPKPRRLQIEIQPVQVAQCPRAFVVLSALLPDARAPGGEEQATLHTSETASAAANGVAAWSGTLTFMVTLHRSGVYADDPFLSARCQLELHEPVARGHLARQTREKEKGKETAEKVQQPLCVYLVDLAEFCDTHSDTLDHELVLVPEKKESRGVALSVMISARHCEEIPVQEISAYRLRAGYDQRASQEREMLSEQVDMLTDALQSTVADLESTAADVVAAQREADRAQTNAGIHRVDAEDLAEQLRLAEASCEELEQEHIKLRALAKIALPDGSSGLGVEPETFLVLQRDLVISQRDVRRYEGQLSEAQAQLRSISYNGTTDLPRQLQHTVDQLRRENEQLWIRSHEQEGAESLRKQVLRLENDLEASDVELEAMEAELKEMRDARDKAVALVGRDLPQEIDQLRAQLHSYEAAAADAAAEAKRVQSTVVASEQKLTEAREAAEQQQQKAAEVASEFEAVRTERDHLHAKLSASEEQLALAEAAAAAAAAAAAEAVAAAAAAAAAAATAAAADTAAAAVEAAAVEAAAAAELDSASDSESEPDEPAEEPALAAAVSAEAEQQAAAVAAKHASVVAGHEETLAELRAQLAEAESRADSEQEERESLTQELDSTEEELEAKTAELNEATARLQQMEAATSAGKAMQETLAADDDDGGGGGQWAAAAAAEEEKEEQNDEDPHGWRSLAQEQGTRMAALTKLSDAQKVRVAELIQQGEEHNSELQQLQGDAVTKDEELQRSRATNENLMAQLLQHQQQAAAAVAEQTRRGSDSTSIASSVGSGGGSDEPPSLLAEKNGLLRENVVALRTKIAMMEGNATLLQQELTRLQLITMSRTGGDQSSGSDDSGDEKPSSVTVSTVGNQPQQVDEQQGAPSSAEAVALLEEIGVLTDEVEEAEDLLSEKDEELEAASGREQQLEERILQLEDEVAQLNEELEELEGDSDE